MSRRLILYVLTEDLLEKILEKLDCDSDQKAWRLVCKEFLRVDSFHRKSLRIIRAEFIPSLLKKCADIEALDLSVCARIDDATVSIILSRDSVKWTSRLRRLVLSRSVGLKAGGLEMLVRACVNLESVDVSYCWGFGDREASALSCAKGLKELRLDKCLDLTDVGLANVAIGCSKLEKLSLKWCMGITDLSIDLLVKKCSRLKSLDVSYLKVTRKGLCSIASLNKLEVLNMVGCSLIDDIALEFLRNGCPVLQELNVLRCGGVTAFGLLSVIRGHGGLLHINAGYCISELSKNFVCHLKELKNLKSIKVDGANLSEVTFQYLRSCQSLIELGLSKCIGVTSVGVIELASGCINLEILDLTCCDSIDDEAILVVAKSCRNLTCLKLEACDLISETGLEHIGSYCTKLEELDLTDCIGVDDQGLKFISKCSELLCLKLGLCTTISDDGLTFIASKCSKLRELDLYRCTDIGDRGLHALSCGCDNLQKLNLSYCIKISDRGMYHISHMKELRDLELRSLVNITGQGLALVAMGCMRLAELDLKRCANIDDSGFCALACNALNLRQINISHCSILDRGLGIVMGNLSCLQDAKLVDLSNVSVTGFELALRASYFRLKKVKMLSPLRMLLTRELIQSLEAKGCKIRWE